MRERGGDAGNSFLDNVGCCSKWGGPEVVFLQVTENEEGIEKE